MLNLTSVSPYLTTSTNNMDIIIRICASQSLLRWGHDGLGFRREFVFGADLPLNVVIAAFLYGILLAVFAPNSILAFLRASNSSDWIVQPLKKFTWSWIRLAAMIPFM